MEATLEDVTMRLADIVEARSDAGKEYGVFLVPEGLIEFIPEIKLLIDEINQALNKDGCPKDDKGSESLQEYVLQQLSESSKALFN